jgi:type III pantothenate kinase
MLLAIDIGNSQITLGLGEAEGWRACWRLPTVAARTADEYGVLVMDLFKLDGFAAESVDRIAMSSVVPALSSVIRELCRQRFGLEALLVGPGTRTGMALHYDPPTALGSDRLVDAVAARARYGAPVIVVDFGTATTFNVVDAEGRFIGGAIAPGVGVAASALAAAGARLSRVDLAGRDLPPLVGRNTDQSMRSGVLYGYAGLVGGLLARIESELGPACPRPTVVATGGMAGAVAPLVARIDHLHRDLILDGLRLIDGLNQDPAHSMLGSPA